MKLRISFKRIQAFCGALQPWQGGAIVAAAAIGLRIVLTWNANPTAFGDTREYLEYARQLLQRTIPPVGRRMPGYPLFLIAAGGAAMNLHRVMRVQQILGITCNLMVYEILRRLTGRIGIALAGGLVGVLLVDLAGWELEILSETFARFLVIGAFFFLTVAATSGRRSRPAMLAASLLAGLASIERAVLVLLVIGVLAGICFIPNLRSRIRPTLLAVCMLLGVTPFTAVVAHNWIRDRFTGPATGAGFSLLDAVGNPQIYRNLPRELRDIRSIYQHLADGSPSPGRFVNWSETVRDLSKTASVQPAPTDQDHFSDSPAWDAFAGRVAKRCIRAVPVGYVRVWAATMNEFLYDFKAVHGLFRTSDDYYGNRPQLWGLRLAFIQAFESLWKVGFPCLSVLSIFLFPLTRWRIHAEERIRGLSWLIFAFVVTIMLVNTAIESCPGQGRYRVPVEELMLVLCVLSTCFGSAETLD